MWKKLLWNILAVQRQKRWTHTLVQQLNKEPDNVILSKDMKDLKHLETSEQVAIGILDLVMTWKLDANILISSVVPKI